MPLLFNKNSLIPAETDAVVMLADDWKDGKDNVNCT